jgi:hypothetical protein
MCYTIAGFMAQKMCSMPLVETSHTRKAPNKSKIIAEKKLMMGILFEAELENVKMRIKLRLVNNGAPSHSIIISSRSCVLKPPRFPTQQISAVSEIQVEEYNTHSREQ